MSCERPSSSEQQRHLVAKGSTMPARVPFVCTALLVFLVAAQFPFSDGYRMQRNQSSCYYNGTHFMEGSIVPTKEPCLMCKCSEKTLICALKVCPEQPIPPPRGCILVHKSGSCCPYLQCSKLNLALKNNGDRKKIHFLDYYEKAAQERLENPNSYLRRSDDDEVEDNGEHGEPKPFGRKMEDEESFDFFSILFGPDPDAPKAEAKNATEIIDAPVTEAAPVSTTSEKSFLDLLRAGLDFIDDAGEDELLLTSTPSPDVSKSASTESAPELQTVKVEIIQEPQAIYIEKPDFNFPVRKIPPVPIMFKPLPKIPTLLLNDSNFQKLESDSLLKENPMEISNSLTETTEGNTASSAFVEDKTEQTSTASAAASTTIRQTTSAPTTEKQHTTTSAPTTINYHYDCDNKDIYHQPDYYPYSNYNSYNYHHKYPSSYYNNINDYSKTLNDFYGHS
uniref:Uncharacterized protein n=1 Tax=Anopheles atroparvus TaxID=41427 RepID=A0A182JHY1_ANOAO